MFDLVRFCAPGDRSRTQFRSAAASIPEELLSQILHLAVEGLRTSDSKGFLNTTSLVRAQERRKLLACLRLVCRTWHKLCQPLVFQAIILYRHVQLTKLARLLGMFSLEGSPPPNVERLSIVNLLEPIFHDPVWERPTTISLSGLRRFSRIPLFESVLVSGLPHTLEHVRELACSCVLSPEAFSNYNSTYDSTLFHQAIARCYAPFPPRVCTGISALLRRFTALEVLYLQAREFKSFRHFVQFLGALPNLTKVHLKHVSWPEDTAREPLPRWVRAPKRISDLHATSVGLYSPCFLDILSTIFLGGIYLSPCKGQNLFRLIRALVSMVHVHHNRGGYVTSFQIMTTQKNDCKHPTSA